MQIEEARTKGLLKYEWAFIFGKARVRLPAETK